MQSIFEVYLPIRTVSEANSSEHWTKKAKRHKHQKKIVWLTLHQQKPKISLPCNIILTRIAPRHLDKDQNLPMCFKWISDAICEYIHPGLAVGRADSDERIGFVFAQCKGEPKTYGIKIEIYC